MKPITLGIAIVLVALSTANGQNAGPVLTDHAMLSPTGAVVDETFGKRLLKALAEVVDERAMLYRYRSLADLAPFCPGANPEKPATLVPVCDYRLQPPLLAKGK